MLKFFVATLIIFTVSHLQAASVEKASSVDKKTESNKPAEEEKTKSFTDQIKNVRVYGDDYDVFFVENGGPYDVPYSFPNSKSDQLPEDIINEAFKNGSSVTVTVDNKTDTLLSISTTGDRDTASEDSPKAKPLPKELDAYKDILQKFTSSPKK